MALEKQRMYRKNLDGTKDLIYRETSSDLVKHGDTDLNTKINNIDTSLAENVNKLNFLEENKIKFVYGCKCDGITDDTLNLQRALNECDGELILPNSPIYIKYRGVGSSILNVSKNISLIGRGRNSVLLIDPTTPENIDVIDASPSAGSVGNWGRRLSNFRIAVKGNTNPHNRICARHAINIETDDDTVFLYNFEIDNLSLEGTLGSSINVSNNAYYGFTAMNIHDNVLYSGMTSNKIGDSVTIKHNMFQDKGLQLSSNLGSYAISIEDNNMPITIGEAIIVDGQGGKVSIINNQIEMEDTNVSESAILVKTPYTNIRDNNIAISHVSSIYCIKLLSSNNVIESNVLNVDSTKNQKHIYVSETTSLNIINRNGYIDVSIQSAAQTNVCSLIIDDMSTSTLGTSKWTPITLLNGWVAVQDTVYGVPSYRINNIGEVEFRGVIAGGTLSGTIASLGTRLSPISDNTTLIGVSTKFTENAVTTIEGGLLAISKYGDLMVNLLRSNAFVNLYDIKYKIFCASYRKY